MCLPESCPLNPKRPSKIVVVEDDPQIRALVDTMLTADGYTVVTTGDPTEAVELVRREQPDLVLCDIAMPVLDGYGVLKALQSDPATARYPVVFLTAHREFSERVRAFRFGVVDYLTKPFSRKILLGKIERVLQGLSLRSGTVDADGEPVDTLLGEVQRQARTGVLTVETPDGAARLVIKAGEVVAGHAPPAVDGQRATFEELDITREDVVAHDPSMLPHTEGPLPKFEVPSLVRDVLVVDDNAVFRKFLSRLLGSQGFAVHEALEGESGLQAALDRRPWLIITDVRMPGMDGFEFCRRVRSHSLLRQTPLLFLSGWDDYKARYQGLELGADDYLSKGTPVRELLIRIHLLMKRYTQVHSRAGRGSGMEGDVQVIGAPGILQMCHLGRLTGVLTAIDGVRRVEVGFRDGEIVEPVSGHGGRAALYEFLAWERGRFQFAPGDPGPGPLAEGFDHLLLEGCRQLDDQRRGAGPEPEPEPA